MARPTDDIPEITPEMIEVAAKAIEADLWDCNLSPSAAYSAAESALTAALSLPRRKGGPKRS